MLTLNYISFLFILYIKESKYLKIRLSRTDIPEFIARLTDLPAFFPTSEELQPVSSGTIGSVKLLGSISTELYFP